ncbi:MAG: hypothetical protein IJ243_01985 [Prevotella sp.]|nr:hypothetical protein [Prevotella sp.]
MKKVFIPNDGRPPIEFTSLEDIKEYMGDIMDTFGPIETQGEHVLTRIGGQYIQIGAIR